MSLKLFINLIDSIAFSTNERIIIEETTSTFTFYEVFENKKRVTHIFRVLFDHFLFIIKTKKNWKGRDRTATWIQIKSQNKKVSFEIVFNHACSAQQKGDDDDEKKKQNAIEKEIFEIFGIGNSIETKKKKNIWNRQWGIYEFQVDFWLLLFVNEHSNQIEFTSIWRIYVWLLLSPLKKHIFIQKFVYYSFALFLKSF